MIGSNIRLSGIDIGLVCMIGSNYWLGGTASGLICMIGSNIRLVASGLVWFGYTHCPFFYLILLIESNINFNYLWKEVRLERIILDMKAVSRVIVSWLNPGELMAKL